MTRRFTVSALLVVLLATVPSARAGIVFSNLGSGSNVYDTLNGNVIGNGQDNSGSNYAEADTFTTNAAYTVTSVEIALSSFGRTNTDTLQVSVVADSGSGSPGSNVLAFWQLSPGSLSSLGGSNALQFLNAGSGFSLPAGQYWVTVADISGGTDSNAWNWNTTGDSSPQALSTDGGSTWIVETGLPPGAYQINGTPSVPEPSSLLLLAGGVLGLLGAQRHRLRRRMRRTAKNRPQAEPLEERVVLSTTFTWTEINTPTIGNTNVGAVTSLLLPNGTVMTQGDYIYNGGNPTFKSGVSDIWSVMKPDSSGNWANNSYSGFSLMTTPRLYFASNVLPNGNVFLLGGEYSGNSGSANITRTGEMFNGSTSTWSSIANFPQSTFGDDPSMLLNNGLILLGTGAAQSTFTYLYNPTSSSITTMVNGSSQTIAPGAYSSQIPMVYTTSNDETGFTKLANGQVVFYDVFASIALGGAGYAEKFDPATGTWLDISPGDGSANGSIPLLSAKSDGHGDNNWYELGPSLLLPNGNVFFVSGGTPHTALYNPGTNTWSAGPDMPSGFTADDAPGAVLPNGDVIFAADKALANGAFNGPTALFDYTPSTNTLTQLTGSNAPNDPGLAYGSFPDRMLVLPTGQLMFMDANFNVAFVGTPSGAPQPQWRPAVTGMSGSGSTYTVTGLRLNGMGAGAAYGDDAEMDENYPIVRFVDTSGTTYYATTSNWSLLGVQTGSTPETVTVTLPSGMPAGNYSMIVSGAGIQSFPVAFHLASAVPAPGSATGGTIGVTTSPTATRLGIALSVVTSAPFSVMPVQSLQLAGLTNLGMGVVPPAVDALSVSGGLDSLGIPSSMKPSNKASNS